MPDKYKFLRERSDQVWHQTLLIHGRAPETRIASSLSLIEILTVLYYGGILRYNPAKPLWEGRDRVIISKGHGGIAMYVILADLGFFPTKALESVCKVGSFMGGIPDPIVPGIETVNGSLGHGPGVACGMALALKRKELTNRVFVVVGDGEINEGSVWEAVMFAAHHKLDNLIMILDNNTKCMLGESKNVLNMLPFAPKFESFGWQVCEVDGHNIEAINLALHNCCSDEAKKPRVLIANTIKGHGVASLESDPICHVKSLNQQEVINLTGERDG
jgi:transketolase